MNDPRIKTARSAGCVGSNAIVPRVAKELLKKGDKVLDFGCGPQGVHVRRLQSEGYNADGYDLHPGIGWSCLGLGEIEENIGTYALVYASNVINVQATEKELWDTIEELKWVAGWGFGSFGSSAKPSDNPCPILLNYPGEPRKLGWKMKKMREWLREVGFGVVPEILRPGVMLFRPPERILNGRS